MADQKLQCVMIMAGGTGGHVFPGLAIAQAFQAQGVKVCWLGTPRGLEAQLVPAANIEFKSINISGLRGKGMTTLLKAPIRLISALVQAIRHILAVKPDIIIGMGGFVTGPGGLAAWVLRKPLIIHEQNAIAGLTNRLLAKMASKVLTAFPDTFAAKYNAIYTGNPIRADIAAIPAPAQRYQGRTLPLRLLVLGGSLGAAAINQIIPQVLAQSALPLEVKHQTGQTHFEATHNYYLSVQAKAEIIPFISDMAAAYAWADLVLCRAGALTITELAAVGVPAILVPFPHAVDDHQTVNGKFLVDAGAALMIQQNQLSANQLIDIFQSFIDNRAKLLAMAEAARSLYKGDATQHIITICEQIEC